MCTCIHAWCYCVLHADMRWARAGAEAPLLADVNLTLPPHAMGLVYGRSGAGKTTLLQARALAAPSGWANLRQYLVVALAACVSHTRRRAASRLLAASRHSALSAVEHIQPQAPGRVARHVAACQLSTLVGMGDCPQRQAGGGCA